jgi:osmoprotectant transport system substrate-binding protein
MNTCIRSRVSVALLSCLLAACLVIGSCGGSRQPIVVGSKASADQMILGEIIAQHLERRLGRKIDRRLNIGNTIITYQALQNGQIDIYPEYTGTIVTEILKEQAAADPALVLERARGELRRIGQTEMLDPLGFSAEPVAIIAAADPRAANVSTLSEAAAVANGWKIGVSYEFQQRQDGVPALTQYHLPMTDPVRAMEASDLFRNLGEGQVSMIFGFLSDGELATGKWKALTDDRKLFTPQQACILVRQTVLDGAPGLRGALAELSGKISTATMRRLSAEVSIDHHLVADVARTFVAGLK